MRFRKLAASDVPAAVTLYARCMADDHYFREIYKLRRETDRDIMADKLMAEHGPVLARVIGHGTSVGLQDGGVLAGIYICFWYDAIRKYDPELFRDIFPGGEDILSGKLAELHGTILYGLSVCVEPDLRRQGLATRMVQGVLSTFRPDFLATDVSAPESLPIYRRMLCSETDLGDGRILCVIRT